MKLNPPVVEVTAGGRLHRVIDAQHVALIFEGGGMRNSYTAACVNKLIDNDVRFGWVGGVSAGSSHTVNFLSRDAWRSEESFVELAEHPEFGGMRSLLKGSGFFNAEFIYQEAAEKELPFDFEAFWANPAQLCIGATRADTGETTYFCKEDLPTAESLSAAVRASSTLPLIMPILHIDGVPYVDGALGDSGGIVIEQAEKAGFEKFLFIGTRPRGYVRPSIPSRALFKRIMRNYPAVAESINQRPVRYNAAATRLLELESTGQACLFYPENMQVNSMERDTAKLRANFEAGKAQCEREWPRWEEFLVSD